MRTIRWGMIGCGDVAEVKSGPGFYKADHSSLVAVMRRNGALAADFARRHGVVRSSDDAAAIIDAPDIDAVYVATFTDSHHDYVLRCARAGKPVYVEKPMAATHAEAEEMVAVCASLRVPLWVGYYRRALPRFLKVKELIASGAVGQVRMVSSRALARPAEARPGGATPWRLDPSVARGGLFFDAACHTFDVLDFLFGPIVRVRGIAANQAGAHAAEDAIVACYEFGSGIQGSGLWCYSAAEDAESNEIIGDAGRLEFSTYVPSPIRLVRGGAVETFAVADPPHVHQPMIQTIVNELNGIGRCDSTGVSAARTAWVMDEILGPQRA